MILCKKEKIGVNSFQIENKTCPTFRNKNGT